MPRFKSGFYHPISILILALITLTVAVAIFANSGFFANKNVPAPSQTPQPSPKPSPKTSPIDDTANWKTYTNVKYKYKFNYPSDFEIVSLEWTDKSISDSERWALAVRKQDKMVFSISSIDQAIYPADRYNSTDDYIKNIAETYKGSKIIPMTIDKINVYQINDFKSKPYIAFIKNDTKFEIRLLDEELSNQILSTFKFLD
jgi:hypothetical protein